MRRSMPRLARRYSILPTGRDGEHAIFFAHDYYRTLLQPESTNRLLTYCDHKSAVLDLAPCFTGGLCQQVAAIRERNAKNQDA